MRNNFSQQSFSFAELGRLYAHIIPCFTSLSIVCEGVMVFEEVVVILQYGTRIPKVTQTKSSNTISGLSR